MSEGQLPAIDSASGVGEGVRRLFSMSSIKLVLALVGIFLFFVVAIGAEEAVKVHRTNKKVLECPPPSVARTAGSVIPG